MNLNLADFVTITYDNFCNIPFLVDSQADICIIKENFVPNNSEIDLNEIIELKKITNEIVEMLGTVNLALQFNEFAIYHKFHIVPNNFAIPTNGLIGKDFLQFRLQRLFIYHSNEMWQCHS